MATFVAAYLMHAARVIAAALVMVLTALALWLVIGLLSSMLGLQTSGFVLVSAGLIAAVAVLSGGYVSARHITPRSLLHPVLASLSLAVLYLSTFTSGNTGALSLVILAAAAIVAAVGAMFGRYSGKPPNNRIERSREP